MNYEFGLRGHDIADNFDDMCRNAKSSNIKKLQFALAKTVNNVDFDTVGYDAALSAKIKNQLDFCGLHVSVLGCYINPVEKDEKRLDVSLTRFMNFLHYAKDFGAGVIGTETGVLKTLEETHSEENYLTLVENMRPIVKEAEKLGVTVGVEPVYATAICSPQRMRRMLDDIASENLKVILDISNMTYPQTRHMQQDIINKSFELFGDKIKVVHVKDFTFDGDQKSFAVAGEGELMTKLLFEKIDGLETMPELILDCTKLSIYKKSLDSLKKILD